VYIQKQNQQNIIGTVFVKFHAIRVLFLWLADVDAYWMEWLDEL